MKARELTRLIGVLAIGFLLGSGISPLNAADPVSTTGEILKVCINTKTGAIRVASKCTSAERKTVLGGVGVTDFAAVEFSSDPDEVAATRSALKSLL